MAEKHDLNPTDASNTARFPEGQAASTVNNGARALEGMIARYHLDTTAAEEGTLSGSVVSISVNQSSITLTGTTSNYIANLMVVVKNGASATPSPFSVSLNGIGPISVKDMEGNDPVTNAVGAGVPMWLWKDDANNNFRLLLPNPTIPAGSVVTADLADGAVTGAKIGNDQVDSQHYAAGSIDLEHMSANSVDSDQYVDGSIDSAHIANDQINSQHYAAGSIDNEHLANNAVDTAEIADDAVTSAKLAAGALLPSGNTFTTYYNSGTGSGRAFSTIYTNTDSTARLVYVTISVGNVTAYLRGQISNSYVCRQYTNPDGATLELSIFMYVPAGMTYRVYSSESTPYDWKEIS